MKVETVYIKADGVHYALVPIQKSGYPTDSLNISDKDLAGSILNRPSIGGAA